LVRCALAAVLLAAHVPLPAAPVAGPAKGAGRDRQMACCAPKACCTHGHACATGGGCATGASANDREAARGGSAPRMIAGGCGNQTPQVTPVQLDPTMAAQAVALVPARS